MEGTLLGPRSGVYATSGDSSIKVNTQLGPHGLTARDRGLYLTEKKSASRQWGRLASGTSRLPCRVCRPFESSAGGTRRHADAGYRHLSRYFVECASREECADETLPVLVMSMTNARAGPFSSLRRGSDSLTGRCAWRLVLPMLLGPSFKNRVIEPAVVSSPELPTWAGVFDKNGTDS